MRLPWSRKAPEKRSVVDFSAFSDLLTAVHAGVPVSQTSSVNLPVVYRCVSLNSETIAAMPVSCFQKRGNERLPAKDPPWLRSPNDWQTLQQFLAESQVSLDLDGNCYWLKATDSSGRLVGLFLLPPEAVTVEQVTIDKRVRVIYRFESILGPQTYAATSIVHLRGVTLPGQLKGLSPIACAKQAIGVGLAAEMFNANFYGSGATLSGVVKAPGKVDEELAEKIRLAFTKKHGGVSESHAIGVLFGGAEWVPISVKPDEALALATAQWTATQVAFMFGLPPHYVTEVEGTKGYVTGVTESKLLWYTTGLQPRIVRFEQALSSLIPGDTYVKFNIDAFMRSTPQERADFYSKMVPVMGLVPDEIRELEDRDPLPGGLGREPLKSVQFVWETGPPGTPPQQPADQAA